MYGFWRTLNKEERVAKQRYLQMFYNLQFRNLVSLCCDLSCAMANAQCKQDDKKRSDHWSCHLFFQVKTVPRVGEQPPRIAPSTSTGVVARRNEIVARPKERQVCPLLRNLLKKDRGSNNWLTCLLFGIWVLQKAAGQGPKVSVRFFLPAMKLAAKQHDDEC
jgi:sucrose synthase